MAIERDEYTVHERRVDLGFGNSLTLSYCEGADNILLEFHGPYSIPGDKMEACREAFAELWELWKGEA